MDREEEMQKNKEAIEAMGFEYGGDFVPDHFDGDRRVIKVNLPEFEDESSWRTGNGEGCWGYLRKEEDLEKYDKGVGEFEIILLNASVYYMGILRWGTVILAQGNGRTKRPVLKKEWITPFIERLSKTE